MKNIFYHIDCRKTFCHPCEPCQARFPSCFFYDLYDDRKYKSHHEYIYDNEGVNGTTDEKILKHISKYINSDFVIAEGYACRFWLESEYKNHLLLINPEFNEQDDIDKLFSHPDNTYVIISYEYRHTINDLCDNYLTEERAHTPLYYGAKCEDTYSFYGLGSITRFFITEILDGTEYWKVQDMIRDMVPWHLNYYDYGYNPEYALMPYSFRPEHPERYESIMMNIEDITGIDKKADEYYGIFKWGYMMKHDGKIVSLSRKRHEIMWKRLEYSQLHFCNKYTEDIFKAHETLCIDKEYHFPVMMWILTKPDKSQDIYVEYPICCGISKSDMKQLCDYKIEKYKSVFNPN